MFSNELWSDKYKQEILNTSKLDQVKNRLNNKNNESWE